jgi:hypothetical protein
MKVITDINKLDLELWYTALQIVEDRLAMHTSLLEYVKHEKNDMIAAVGSRFMQQSQFSCFKVDSSFFESRSLPVYLSSQLGIFRPPGHKGPL